MKAIIMDRHGGLDVLRYGDLPDPVAGEGQAPKLDRREVAPKTAWQLVMHSHRRQYRKDLGLGAEIRLEPVDEGNKGLRTIHRHSGGSCRY